MVFACKRLYIAERTDSPPVLLSESTDSSTPSMLAEATRSLSVDIDDNSAIGPSRSILASCSQKSQTLQSETASLVDLQADQTDTVAVTQETSTGGEIQSKLNVMMDLMENMDARLTQLQITLDGMDQTGSLAETSHQLRNMVDNKEPRQGIRKLSISFEWYHLPQGTARQGAALR